MQQLTLEQSAPAQHAAPTHPMPGDAVRLDGPYYGAKPGEIAIIDSTYYGMDDEVMFTFRPSAFRGPARRMDMLEDCGVTDTPAKYRLPIGRDRVSVSGGPCPFANMADLEYVGTHRATFWRWRDGIAGQDRGENYQLDVPLWSWKGQPEG